MGSLYNPALIKVVGDFVTDIGGYEFQDKYALSENGNGFVLIQWRIQRNEPRFVVWKLSESKKIVSKSVRYESYCGYVELENDTVTTTFTQNGKAQRMAIVL